ncbi:MAG: hypothetical protein V2I24_10870, partial [Halieaceae bacterium]|nr:hypothetical protein [Halieaceae bacterium]
SIQYAQHELEVSEHGDLRRRADDIAALHEASGMPPKEIVAELYIDAREYDTALDLIASVETPYSPAETAHAAIASTDIATLEAHWFRGDFEAIDAMLPRVVATFEEYRDENQQMSLIGEALLAVMGKRYTIAENAVARWLRESTVDLAARALAFPYACQVLGQAAAARAAADCIRRGLSEPSLIRPFVDPQLPYYDAIRDSAEFQALLEEIEARW